MILSGSRLIATNLDPSPKKTGWANLGIKAVVAMIEEAKETIIIGDTMDTDILGGVQLGYTTILTLSGVSRRENLADYAFKPDLIVDFVTDIELEKVLSIK